MKKMIKVLAVMTALAVMMTGCSTVKNDTGSKANISIDGPYTVTAMIRPFETVYYYVGGQYVSDDAMAAIVNSYDFNNIETTINIVSKNGMTKCDITDSTGSYSYYCDGNLLAEGELNMIQGNTIYTVFKNLLTKIVYKEEIAGENGPHLHLISNLDNKARDLDCEVTDTGEVTSLTTTYPFNDYSFDIGYLSAPQIPEMDVTQSEKINKGDLVDIINTMADYMFSSTVQRDYAAQPPTQPVEEEPVEVVEEPQEPESLIVTNELVTLSAQKDLFVKVSFSDHVEDIEFTGPTGGTYKAASGNVEYMRDDDVTKDVYFKIPNADMGTWQIMFDNAKNDVTYETVTDNKIKINSLDISPAKDGIITVTPKLAMDKGFDVNYEYHVDIISDNTTVSHSTNILNTKTDKAKYNVSIMDLPTGIYKVRLRLEYMYDGQHYINMFTSNDFTID